MTNEQEYTSITHQTELDAYCQKILANSDISWIAIDTEFVRVDTYFPELSLVQIQDCLGNTALIDPIAISENATSDKPLHSLSTLLADTGTTKVFHSARQDIEVLYLIENIMPQNIFDTQIAAIFRKHGELAGFARVIQAELNVELDKSQTRTNWHARPLSEQQINYALDDVRYLAPLYETYLELLSPSELKAVKQDCDQMLDESIYKPNPTLAGQKIKNVKNLRSKGLAIVNTLAQWRENYAITNNQPKKWVMSDEVIVSIAKRPPKTEQALYKVPNIKASSVKEFGEAWIELIDAVFASDSSEFPTPKAKPKKISVEEETIMHFLSSYIQQVALEYGLVSNHIISKNQLLEWLRNPSITPLIGWRAVLVGEDIKDLMSGKAELKIHNRQIQLTQSH